MTHPIIKSYLFLMVVNGVRTLSLRFSTFDAAQTAAKMRVDCYAAQNMHCYCQVMPSIKEPEIVIVGDPIS